MSEAELLQYKTIQQDTSSAKKVCGCKSLALFRVLVLLRC